MSANAAQQAAAVAAAAAASAGNYKSVAPDLREISMQLHDENR